MIPLLISLLVVGVLLLGGWLTMRDTKRAEQDALPITELDEQILGPTAANHADADRTPSQLEADALVGMDHPGMTAAAEQREHGTQFR